MPIEKHTINIIFFPILYFFFLNKNSESKIAMSIIVIAHTIIYLYICLLYTSDAADEL